MWWNHNLAQEHFIHKKQMGVLHGIIWSAQILIDIFLLLQPWSPTASLSSYYPSSLQLHRLEAFYFKIFHLRPRLEPQSCTDGYTGWKMVTNGEAEESQKCTAGGAAVT